MLGLDPERRVARLRTRLALPSTFSQTLRAGGIVWDFVGDYSCPVVDSKVVPFFSTIPPVSAVLATDMTPAAYLRLRAPRNVRFHPRSGRCRWAG